MKKILVIIILLLLCCNFSYSQKETALQEYSRVSYRIVMNGENISAVRTNKNIPSVKSILNCLNTSRENKSPNISVTFTYIGCSTIYDFISHATPQNFVQDPDNPNRIHTVCMYAPPGDGTTFPNRRTKYYYSTNKGTTWTYVCDVPNGVRSGWPAISLASNGIALISNHNTNISTITMVHFYYDASPGLGSFTELYPLAYMDYYWPKTVTTNSILNPNKFINVSSASGRDSCFWIAGTSFGPTPGTFSPWHFMYSDQAETYSIAKGTDGRIGILYHNNDALLSSNYGDIFFMESTNHGVSFGSSTKIFDANVSPTGDSLGHFRGIQLIYQGNIPKVVFEVCKQTTSSSFFENDGKNHIRFWSTSLPGSDPNRSIKIADTGSVGYHPLINTNPSSNDALTCICRPTIGVSSNGAVLFVAFMVPSNYVGGSVDTVSFNDVWFMYSTNSGSNWVAPVKINTVSPIRDWAYPCLSLTNDYTSTNYYANLLMISDSIPGSYVNFSSNGESNAKFMFVRVGLNPTRINNINSESPNEFKLYQNYPNPFNPSTIIRFQIPKLSSPHALGGDLVTLKVYDILGKEVATLVNEKLSPGIYEISFDVSSISSGIYFYKLEIVDPLGRTENFTDVKRMLMIK